MFLALTISFSKGIMWLEYQANKEFISKNLCINKFKPLLRCKGNCQLMKRMAEEEKENSSVPVQKLKAGFDETLLLHTSRRGLAEVKARRESWGFLQQSSCNGPVFPVFHPPA
jgi:hypothetical protein